MVINMNTNMKKHNVLISFFLKIWYGIKPVFLIFNHDVRTIFKNRYTVIIIMGLCFLPSLYAWINIYACWDPYAKTGNLPVAIVNLDEGAVYNGKLVNVGSSVIEEVKKNDSIGWDFVDEWQANYGLNQGKYYALIEIPRNFSLKLTTLTTTTPQKPVIIYRVNEKLNSIATKITDAAKNKLVDNIKTNFVKSVTTEAINTLKNEMVSSNLDVSKLSSLTDTLTQMNGDIVKLKQYISDSNSDTKNYQTFIDECSQKLPMVNDQIESLQNILKADKALAQTTEKTIESVSVDLNTDISQLKVLDSYNQQLITLLKQANSNNLESDTINVMQNCSNICASLDIMLKADAQNLSSINANYNLSSLSLTEDSLTYMDKLVLSEETALNTQIPILKGDSSQASISSALTAISGLSTEISSRIITLSGQISSDAVPTLNNLVSEFDIQLDDVGTIAEIARALVPQLSALDVFSTASGKLTANQMSQMSDSLTAIQDSLNTLITKINGISTEDLDYIVDTVENHPDQIAEFISSPITVKEVDVYSTTTFGVGLTPFYTVLAIWIGALLSCALLAVNCKQKVIGEFELNWWQKHFGKMILFLGLSLIQSAIICLGDIYLLGVVPADLPLMLSLTALTSITFTVIIFTIVALFGSVGKAIIVVMMVFQIAGAGGIYPIQTNPAIFGVLEPLWPFTYAINYYREAIAGPIKSSVDYNVTVMLIFTGVFLFLGVLQKIVSIIKEKIQDVYDETDI